jgi:hypothetical protein
MSEIILKSWESDDLTLDDDLIINDIIFKTLNEVKIYMIENKKNHKFLNKLNDKDKISDNDYHYLMRWYYKRKTYKELTYEEIEANNRLYEKRQKEDLEKYQKLLELLEKKNLYKD